MSELPVCAFCSCANVMSTTVGFALFFFPCVLDFLCLLTCRSMHLMEGELPPCMSGSCGACINGKLYIFGGFDDKGYSNQVLDFSLCLLEAHHKNEILKFDQSDLEMLGFYFMIEKPWGSRSKKKSKASLSTPSGMRDSFSPLQYKLDNGNHLLVCLPVCMQIQGKGMEGNS